MSYQYKKSIETRIHYYNTHIACLKIMLCGKSRLHKHTMVKSEVTCKKCKELLHKEILKSEIK